MNMKAVTAGSSTHLVVPDNCDVRWRAAVVRDIVMFGTRDPAGREEEGVELHAKSLPSHVLHWQLATGTDDSI